VFTPPVEPPTIAWPPPELKPVPPPAPKPVPPVPPSENFHSLSSDFKNKVEAEGASRFAVIAAEQDSRATRPLAPKQKKSFPVVPLLLGTLLIVVGGTGAFFAYRYFAANQAVPVLGPQVASLVVADEYRELDAETAEDTQSALAELARETLVQGNVLVTYVTETVTGEKGLTSRQPADGGVLAKAILLRAPDILLRNTAPESTVGIVHAGEESRAFFLLRVSSYERTFSGMLTWEPLMARDLALLYPLYSDTAPQEPASVMTATSTPAAAFVSAPAETRFRDAIVANHDVRVLRDTAGRSLLMYGYADKETLIIARDEAAYTELLNRLSASSE
jgi:hypothetical protein